MSQPSVIMVRSGRAVSVAGPDGGPLSKAALNCVRESLTYYEKKYVQDHTSESGGGYEFIRREMYSPHPSTGLLTFFLGARPKVAAALVNAGFSVDYRSKSVRTDLPGQHELDWDGLFADFEIYEGQDEAIAKILSCDGCTIGATTGAGKAQPLDSLVMTVDGPKQMRDVRVGDKVCDPFGGATEVRAIHPQGEKDIFRVTFSDGRSVECCGEHIWSVRTRGPKSKDRLKTTYELVGDLVDDDAGSKWLVDACAPVSFTHQPAAIPPYTMGLLLGDGSVTQDAETENDDRNSYRRELETLGLTGLDSPERFIPDLYLFNSVEVRKELLTGLLAADGHVSSDGATIEYSSSSLRLVQGARFLVESLGGTAYWSVKTTNNADSYKMIFELPTPAEYLRSDDEKDRLKPRTGHEIVTRAIRSIDPVGRKEARCITVAADDGMYLTDHCIKTHNSVIMRMLCRLHNRATVHVVTKGSQLAREIEDDLKTVMPDVGFVGAGRRRWGRVTVILADSLHLADTDKVGLVLADEVHELGAPKYSELLGRYRHAVMVGFSATLGCRSDNRDAEIESLFGPTVYDLPYHEAQAMGRVVPITVEWIRVDTGHDPSDGFRLASARERAGIWRHEARNQAIADRCARFATDEQVLVMVKTIEHAAYLKQLMPEYELCYASGSMDEVRLAALQRQGVLPETERALTRQRLNAMRKEFASGKLKKVISNYVWSRGVNFRGLSVLVRADAASSETLNGQIPGRICRRIPGVKESALLVDVWDDWSRTFLNRSYARRRGYAKRQWTQVDNFRFPAGAADGRS